MLGSYHIISYHVLLDFISISITNDSSFDHQRTITDSQQNVAKDSDATFSTRASAAKDAVGDKVDQHSHEGKADLHKEVSSSPFSLLFSITVHGLTNMQAAKH
jgi:hypothetical protein